MKRLLFCAITMSASVEASSFQEYCSNGMATVKIARGHIVNEISVTERKWNEGQSFDRQVVLPDAAVVVSDAKLMEEHKTKICEGKWGIFYWRDVLYKKIKIAKQDGSLFEDNILGVSKDKNFIEASVICEEYGNSEIICDDTLSLNP